MQTNKLNGIKRCNFIVFFFSNTNYNVDKKNEIAQHNQN